ncbi:hypothetical protein [Kitasatospora sp. NPDC050543]|uniref:hypothetical protein n=1 Tax=Kitasatospora sp. NPDC050543 TaxID=3364054 RepID=UPI0037A57B6D
MTRRTVAEERASIHGDLDRWYGAEYDSLSELLDDLLQAHAHELAEKIRAEADELDGWPQTQHDMRRAAALIDPEVAE